METIVKYFLEHLRDINLDDILLASISLVGIILTFMITRQGNKNQISLIIPKLKNDYNDIMFRIKDANDEIDNLLIELNKLKESPGNDVDETISKILYDKEKCGNYQTVRLFYEALGCYVKNNKGLFKHIFTIFTFFDGFWEKNNQVMEKLKQLKWYITDYSDSSSGLYKRYEKERRIQGKKRSFLPRIPVFTSFQKNNSIQEVYIDT
jgi:hypothetical protein